ncbi:hypothetical protein AB0A77_05295 [Streptomyces varsoviensis]|uniref:TolB family protein n=1 Tax=Streptomyces varsoviensis TaxID=67373 RepID=UPI0033EF63F0
MGSHTRHARHARMAVVGAGMCSLVLLPVAAAAAWPEAPRTERAGFVSGGAQAAGSFGGAAISANGRYAVFSSDAADLVPGDTNGQQDLFVKDLRTGATERVSVASDGTQGDSWSAEPAISADGRYVAFTSAAANLVPGDDNGSADVFIRDRRTGHTERITDDGTGAGAGTGADPGNATAPGSRTPTISADGTGTGAGAGVGTGAGPGNATAPGSRALTTSGDGTAPSPGRPAPGGSRAPAISADGAVVAFVSDRSDLVPGDTNTVRDVFAYDRRTRATRRVSVADGGAQANAASNWPIVSADGRHVAFTSRATNLDAGPPPPPGPTAAEPRAYPSYVHDLRTGRTRAASVAWDPVRNTGRVTALGEDGRYAVFEGGGPAVLRKGAGRAMSLFLHDSDSDSGLVPTVAAPGRNVFARDAALGEADGSRPKHGTE